MVQPKISRGSNIEDGRASDSESAISAGETYVFGCHSRHQKVGSTNRGRDEALRLIERTIQEKQIAHWIIAGDLNAHNPALSGSKGVDIKEAGRALVDIFSSTIGLDRQIDTYNRDKAMDSVGHHKWRSMLPLCGLCDPGAKRLHALT